MQKLDDFTQAYVECALWASYDDTGEPLDEFGIGDIMLDSLATMARDCIAFQTMASSFLEQAYASKYDCSQAGHDFWLTRNGHGTGFWDRDLDELTSKALCDVSKAFRESYLYIGDNGKLYHS